MAQWNLIYDLSLASPTSSIFDQSGRHMVVRQELRGSFRSLALTAAFCCLFQTLLGLHLGVCHRERAIAHFALRGGSKTRCVEAASSETTGLVSGAAV